MEPSTSAVSMRAATRRHQSLSDGSRRYESSSNHILRPDGGNGWSGSKNILRISGYLPLFSDEQYSKTRGQPEVAAWVATASTQRWVSPETAFRPMRNSAT